MYFIIRAVLARNPLVFLTTFCSLLIWILRVVILRLHAHTGTRLSAPLWIYAKIGQGNPIILHFPSDIDYNGLEIHCSGDFDFLVQRFSLKNELSILRHFTFCDRKN